VCSGTCVEKKAGLLNLSVAQDLQRCAIVGTYYYDRARYPSNHVQQQDCAQTEVRSLVVFEEIQQMLSMCSIAH